MDGYLATGIEAFGQKVDLTQRIREILINYPEGRSILKELIQNADDAGAKQIKICLDTREHGKASLFANQLSSFQGAALYIFNDAMFTKADFESIQHIGDSLKKESLGKTGKFGVGFNSVYHITDLPGFASGDHIVLFDPHCKYLPNVSSENPGLRIDFVNHNVATKYSDQLTPWKAFGCDTVHSFKGTLFRLPLRNAEMAQHSRIAKSVYTAESILSLFQEFQTEADMILLFLKSVESIELMIWNESQSAPVPLFTAAIANKSDALMKQRGVIHKLVADKKLHEEYQDHLSQFIMQVQTIQFDNNTYSPYRTIQFDWIVCEALVSGNSSKSVSSVLSDKAAREARLKLVPWGGVAALCKVTLGTSNDQSPLPLDESSAELLRAIVQNNSVPQDIQQIVLERYTGPAFCFLPLPVKTGLPVCINGYFELSSNRRDIWYGHDITGIAKIRSQWNQVLLQDVISLCYAKLLLFASKQLGFTSKLFQLFPKKMTENPWRIVVTHLYQEMAKLPIFYTEPKDTSNQIRGAWLKLEESLFIDPATVPSTPLDLPTNTQALTRILLNEGLPIVHAPDFILKMLHVVLPQSNIVRYVTSMNVCKHLSGRAIVRCEDNIYDAKLLLRFLLKNLPLQEGAHRALIGFSLVPLWKGKLATFQARPVYPNADNVVYIIPKEHSLLFSTVDMVVDPDDNDIISYLSDSKLQQLLNIKTLAFEDFCHLLHKMLPQKWKFQDEVLWKNYSATVQDPAEPSVEWITVCWKYVNSFCKDLSRSTFLQEWPLIPSHQGYLVRWRSPSTLISWPIDPTHQAGSAIGSVILSSDVMENLYQLASQLGCRVVAPSITIQQSIVQLHNDLFRPEKPTHVNLWTVPDFLLALREALNIPGITFLDNVTITQQHKRSLRLFLSSYNFGTHPPVARGQFDPKIFAKQLPIYEGYSNDGYLQLSAPNLVVPPPPEAASNKIQLDERLFDQNFLKVVQPSDRALYQSFGIPTISLTSFIMDHLFPKFEQASTYQDMEIKMEPSLGLLQEVMLSILRDLSKFSLENTTFVAKLREIPFVTTLSGKLFAPTKLYDPRISEFHALFDVNTSFPAPPYTEPLMLSTLQSLGLQSVITPSVLSQSAKAIADGVTASMQEPAEANHKVDQLIDRAKALLTYIDNNIVKIITPKNENLTKKIFSTFFNAWGSDSKQKSLQSSVLEGGSDEVDIKLFQIGITSTPWIPVQWKSPSPFLPWKPDLRLVESPLDVRSQAEMWLASASKGILHPDVSVKSPQLLKLFGWDTPLDAKTIARQLVEIGKTYKQLKKDQPELPFASVEQSFASLIPQMYERLSAQLQSPSFSEIKKILLDDPFIWVGNQFVKTSQVALNVDGSDKSTRGTKFTGAVTVDMRPYLFTLPHDLVSFASLFVALGVRNKFDKDDFIYVLDMMKESYAENPLDDRDLQLSVTIVEMLADMNVTTTGLGTGVGRPIYVPNAKGMLIPSHLLVYNNAPWVNYNTSGISIQFQFVHAKISNDVADKVGAKGLTRALIDNNCDLVELDIQNAEAFGQHESLTSRLRHILEMYADGPGILYELIQNADDAGATEVAILYNANSYPTNSLIGPKMKAWQGPALYFYNNALFKEQDFKNIASVGQGSKLDYLGSTGRFGLGFNAVYHFTDLPSFVSGDYLVQFDPHVKYLPSISHHNPGLKIKFTGTNLRQQFPDQFEPYTLFGCDMTNRYEGTLFRFPLRDAATAKDSQIKNNMYTNDDIKNLFSMFEKQTSNLLLFLKHVRKIRLMIHDPFHPDRQDCIASAELILPDPTHQAQLDAISEFVRTSKSTFYQKLKSVDPKSLPSVDANVIVKTSYGAGSTFLSGTNAARIRQEDQWLMSCRIGGITGASQSMAISLATGVPVDSNSPASDIKEASKHAYSIKLVPWGGVAARIKSTTILLDSSEVVMEERTEDLDAAVNSSEEGNHAFCFLPLPVKTGLPVCINGYFELSSNRRDIWYGHDITGIAKIRSQWNQVLLQDVISLCYAKLLLFASKQLGFTSKLFQLFPKKMTENPWRIVVTQLYSELTQMNIFYSQVDNGRWISLNQSLFINPVNVPSYPVDQSESLGREIQNHANVEALTSILLKEGLPIVAVPQIILKMFHSVLSTQSSTVHYITPVHVCKHILLKVQSDQPIEYTKHRIDVLQVLTFCLFNMSREKESSAYSKLIDLPLIPLWNGNTAKVKVPSNAPQNPTNYIIPALQCKLFDSVNDCIIDPFIGSEVVQLLSDSKLQQIVNIKTLTFDDFCHLLHRILPPSWKSQNEVSWIPTSPGEGPTAEWLSACWKYLNQHSRDLNGPIQQWPLIPTQEGFLARIHLESKVLSQTYMLPEPVRAILQKVGCRSLLEDSYNPNSSPAIPIMVEHSELSKFVHAPTVPGILSAIYFASDKEVANLPKLFQCVSSSERRILRSFVSQLNWKNSSALHPLYAILLKSLPIFEVYGNYDPEGTSHFIPLMTNGQAAQVFIAPNVPMQFLDERFLKVSSDGSDASTVVEMLQFLGIKALSRSAFLIDFAFPSFAKQPEAIPPEARDDIIRQALQDLDVLNHETADFSQKLQSMKIFPTQNPKAFIRIQDMVDPLVREFQMVYSKEDFVSRYPALPFCDESILPVLRRLGMKRTVDLATILDAAKCIEKSSKDASVLAAQSSAILTYLLDNPQLFEEMRCPVCSNFTYRDALTQGKAAFHTICFNQMQSSSVKGSITPVRVPSMDIGVFCNQIITIQWLPIQIKQPYAWLPWRTTPSKFMASPSDMRPASQRSLISYCKFILDESQLSTNQFPLHILDFFGWNDPLLIMDVVTQLSSLGKAFNQVTDGSDEDNPALIEVINDIYSFFADHIHELKANNNAMQLIQTADCIWAGNRFGKASQFAFNNPLQLEPYLFSIPEVFTIYSSLWQVLAIKDHFTLTDYVNVLEAIKIKFGENPLQESDMEICKCIITLISDLDTSAINRTIYVPDIDGILVPVKEAVFNDADWIKDITVYSHSQNMRVMHPSLQISNDAAEKLGAQSLRFLLQADDTSENIPCPKHSVVQTFLNDTAFAVPHQEDGFACTQIFYDVLQVLDIIKGKRMQVMLDLRNHPSQSLLLPQLAKFQGPALCIYLDDPSVQEKLTLSTDEIAKLIVCGTTNANYKIRDQRVRYGFGLSSCFHFGDIVQICTPTTFYLFDPSGVYLTDNKQGSANNGVGKAFYYQNSNLPRRFPDQFKPFMFESRSFNLNGILIRIPLRTSENVGRHSLTPQPFNADAMMNILCAFKKTSSSAFLFMPYLESISANVISKESPLKELFSVSVNNALGIQKQRLNLITHNWKGFKLFGFSAVNHSYIMELTCMDSMDGFLGVESKATSSSSSKYTEKWAVYGSLGSGSTRNLALHKSVESLDLLPIGQVAVKVEHAGQFPPSMDAPGYICCGFPLTGYDPATLASPGLVHIHGFFEVSKRQRTLFGLTGQQPTNANDGEMESNDVDSNRTRWNQELMKCIAASYADMLLDLKIKFRHVHPMHMYKYWPYSEGIPPQVFQPLSVPLYSKLAELPLFYTALPKPSKSLNNSEPAFFLDVEDTPRKASEGYFKPPAMVLSESSVMMLMQYFPMFLLPSTVYDSFVSAGIKSVHQISPEVIRPFLQKASNWNKLQLHSNPTLTLDFLMYATSDLRKRNAAETDYRSVHGLPIPLLSGDLGGIGTQKYILASDEERVILPHINHLYLHPLCQRDQVAQLFSSEKFLKGCSISTFSVNAIADNIGALLPSQWKNTKFVTLRYINQDKSLGFVNFDDESSVHRWLQILWAYLTKDKTADQLLSALEPLAGFQLVPLSDKRLASVSLLLSGSIMLPIPNQTKLFQKLGAPILDQAYLKYFITLAPTEQEIPTFTLSRLCSLGECGIQLQNTPNFSAQDRQQLFALFSTHIKQETGQYMFSDAQKLLLQSLPIYLTLDNNYTAIDPHVNFILEAPTSFFQPDKSNSKQFLKYQEPKFYQFLGVTLISASDIFEKFVLPQFSTLSRDEQMNKLKYLKDNWNTLKTNTNLVNALKNIPFVTTQSGKLVPPSLLLDPRTKLFAEIYADAPTTSNASDKFPGHPFNSDSWLDILVELGLKVSMDKQLFLEAALYLQSFNISNPATIGWIRPKSLALMAHLKAYLSHMYSQEFCTQLSNIQFVLAQSYTSNGTIMSTPIDVVTKYKDCILAKDIYLAWSVCPVLSKEATPPMQEKFSITSPPPPSTVVQHLLNMSDAITESWQFPKTLTAAYIDILDYLQREWTSISSSLKLQLKEAPLIPIEDRILMKPKRICMHMQDNLSPFMFQLPMQFMKYETILKELGLLEVMTSSHFGNLFMELYSDYKDTFLGPNELKTYIKLLDVVSAYKATIPKRLFIPDGNGRLRSLKDCYYNDAPWILARIRTSDIHIVNSKISVDTCMKLGIQTLSQSFKEELLSCSQLDSNDPISSSYIERQRNLTALINSQEFAKGVCVIIKNMRSHLDYLTSLNENIIMMLLHGYKVEFVRKLKTKFIQVAKKKEVTSNYEALTFVDGKAKVIYLAMDVPGFSSLSVEHILARQISKILNVLNFNFFSNNVQVTTVLPIGPLLGCIPGTGMVAKTLQLLQMEFHYHPQEGSTFEDHSTRGVPGCELLAADKKLLKLNPLHSFLPNEIVAYQDKDNILRYGIITAEGLDNNESNKDTIAVALKKIPVQVNQFSVELIPASKLFVFKNTKGEKGPAQNDNNSPTNMEPTDINNNASPITEAAPITHEEYLNAVKDLLHKAGLPLNVKEEQLMNQLLLMKNNLSSLDQEVKLLRGKVQSQQEQLDQAQHGNICQICREQEANQVLAPCGHILCSSCFANYHKSTWNAVCPFCRREIVQTVKMFKP